MPEISLRQLLEQIPARYHDFVFWRLQPEGGRVDTYYKVDRDYLPICIYTWTWGAKTEFRSDINGQGIEGLRPFHDLTVTQVLRIGCTRGGHTGAEVR